jgi:sugar lactone lactonase YvrE
VALLAHLAWLVVPAGAVERDYDSRISPFAAPGSVSFDAQGNVWVTDGGQNKNPPGLQGIYLRSPFPSQTILEDPNTNSAWGSGIPLLQGSVNRETGELFVAQSNGRVVFIFDSQGDLLRSWSAINGSSGSFETGAIHVAVDNSNSDSRGRIYLSLSKPEDDVEAVDDQQRPVDFPATASYIKDNRITGTPEGPFGETHFVSVDEEGNIYVTDTKKNQVDVFSSTGEFVRSLEAPGATPNYAVNGPGVGGVAVDPTNGDVLISEGQAPFEEGGLRVYDRFGNELERVTAPPPGEALNASGTPAVDATGHLYSPGGSAVNIFDPAPPRAAISYSPVTGETTTSGTVHATIDPNGGGDVTECQIEYGTSMSYGKTVACSPDPASAPPGSNFAAPTPVSAELPGINPPLTVEQTYHYRAVVKSGTQVSFGSDQTYTPHKVIGLRTDAATAVTESGATLNASLVGDGSETHYLFEWGRTTAYGNSTAAAPGEPVGMPAGPERTSLTFPLAELAPYSTYHYRVVATGGPNTSYGEDRTFTTPAGAPTIGAEWASKVHSDGATLNAEITPNGADTAYSVEYVPDQAFQESEFAAATTSPIPAIPMGRGKRPSVASVHLDGVQPGTLYHYRLVASNSAGVTVGTQERTFLTYPVGFEDTCPNAHERQQTGAAYLLDCRAYELASAANGGGYDVESDLVPGQKPFDEPPLAIGPSQLLYGVHSGGIPGTGNPTNHGVDPYVATRGENGWTTKYVGIPADNPFASGAFGSPLLEADSGLDTFAFGGPELCFPCFEDGSTGVPVRRPDGSLVQGMAGSLDPGPSAAPAGYIGRHLSADGTRFVFGSTSQFEPDGNSNGDVTIYSRDLEQGTTEVVSKDPETSETMTGAGIGELDISSNGQKVVFGRQLATDEAGNRYWHLYMSLGGGQTVDLTPATTAGALYAGMTADGSKVYFTSADHLTGDDTDSSVDLFRADIEGSSVTLERVSIGEGGAGDVDTCEPAANTVHAHWNTLAAGNNCDVLAIGGGGGVAPDDGAVYFLSPEALEPGSGENQPIPNAPNLYVAEPGGQPHFIRALESSATTPIPLVSHPFRRNFGAFNNPVGVEFDHSTGDMYVLDDGDGSSEHPAQVGKFNSSGQLQTSFATNGQLPVGGAIAFLNLPSSLAVDNAPGSPNQGDLFVPLPFEFAVKAYTPEGAFDKEFAAPLPTGVAVNPVNGNVYVLSFANLVFIFEPDGTQVGAFPIYSEETHTGIQEPTDIAVDSTGRVYVSNGGGPTSSTGKVEQFDPSGTDLGEFDAGPAYGIAVDPADDHVYIDRGDRVTEFDAAGQEVNAPTGLGEISNSIGVAADSGTLAITNRAAGNVALYGPALTPRDPRVDSPVAIESLDDAAALPRAGFQLSPNGDDAVFPSTRSLTGYENDQRAQVYRYDAGTDTVNCSSCSPTGQRSTGDASLPTHGLAVTNDGRVFFNTTEGLVDRDLNEKKDAYEWSPADGTQLISTGTAALGASLLGVSADGTDAYFFTREKLVSGDNNGSHVKVYDARSFGGFPFVPPPVPCKASDECHGPGSVAPRAPEIGTEAGTPIGNTTKKKTKKCKRHRKCRQRHKHRHGKHRHGGHK